MSCTPKRAGCGRVLPNGDIAFELSSLPLVSVKDDDPKLCPDPSRDRRTNSKGLDYENYIKTIVNPQGPTPPIMGYLLANQGKGVVFDDCQRSTGTMVEIKYGYTSLLAKAWGRRLVGDLFLEQARRQVDAAGGRPVRWYFSDRKTKDFAKDKFSYDWGLQNIELIVEPWSGE